MDYPEIYQVFILAYIPFFESAYLVLFLAVILVLPAAHGPLAN